jgi:hypothetical protein
VKNQLTNGTVAGPAQYDPNGNLTNRSLWPGASYTYDDENRLVAARVFYEDEFGVQGWRTDFEYDGLGRLRRPPQLSTAYRRSQPQAYMCLVCEGPLCVSLWETFTPPQPPNLGHAHERRSKFKVQGSVFDVRSPFSILHPLPSQPFGYAEAYRWLPAAYRWLTGGLAVAWRWLPCASPPVRPPVSTYGTGAVRPH